jgi:hypothetical protein
MNNAITFLKGHEGVNIKWVERQAGIPKGLLWLVFNDKRKLSDKYLDSLESVMVKNFNYSGSRQLSTKEVETVEIIKPAKVETIKEEKQLQNCNEIQKCNDGFQPIDERVMNLSKDGKFFTVNWLNDRPTRNSVSFEKDYENVYACKKV